LKIKDPVFIIGSYRGGTSLLFRLLSESSELFSLYRESNKVWERWHRHPEEDADTIVLEKWDYIPEYRADFDNYYHLNAYPNYKFGYLSRVKAIRNFAPAFSLLNSINYFYKLVQIKQNESYRIIDKTPPNCFRVPFIAEMYPSAKFIYLTRDGYENTSSLMNAWNATKKFQFKQRKYLNVDLDIKGYSGEVWKFAMPPGWETFTTEKNLAQVCAFQWAESHRYAKQAFNDMADDRYTQVKFENLLAKPDEIVAQLCDFINIDYSQELKDIVSDMPLVNTFDKPSEAKFKKNYEMLKTTKRFIDPLNHQLGYDTEL
jgi:NADH:ubiquinone oxidoreductase subunit C